MAIGNFSVGTIDLTSIDEKTGLNNTANVYFVPGIGRELSIAELVIAICLDRAADIEAQVVGIMEDMSENTRAIEQLLSIENYLVDNHINGVDPYPADKPDYWADAFAGLFKSSNPNDWKFGSLQVSGDWRNHPSTGVDGEWSWIDYLKKEFGVEISASDYHKILSDRVKINSNNAQGAYFSSDDVSNILGAIESRLDALNTTSQEVLIKLQSLTNKRDQTYDLITSMVKNTLTAGQSIGANMR